MLLPPALGFSPHPPVSVYGTGILKTIAAFLDSWLTHFPTFIRSASRLWIATRFFLCDSSFACTRLSVPRLCFPQMSPQFCFKIGAGISTCCPSDTLFCLALGPDLPRADQLYSWKPWIFGREDSHLSLATHSGILSSWHSTAPSGTASSRQQCSSTIPYGILCFGVVFQPRTFSAQDLSTSELLRTL